ncbi:VOC family protein [Thermoflavimicrobium dichotomicum]|uniref:Lactoylglutathione lyase n=1 Tax=Thermoflavimicrobium dichotomicum TaxID=46223 RepID=A0A1I3MMA4_9BACL|nr:VOC family protein [Thermoflavimicrobium dichotomicum]SFI98099.1 lactoylglutathione lyase [Thermoflavimicrobium dichotomicum]
MAIKKIEHVGVMVKDIEASIRFYQEVLGMKLLYRMPNENLQLAFLGFQDSNETELELIQGYNDQLPAEGKVHHLAFTVDNIEKEIERLKQHDIQWIDEEVTILPNGSKYIFFYGPDGEWIELFESTR